jgi:hypothetical protein
VKHVTKNTAGIVLLSALALFTGCSKSDNPLTDAVSSISSESLPKRYEIKSGIVHFEPMNVMGISTTTETLYFDDYGQKEAKETITESNVMGMKTYEHRMDITDGHFSISYELKKTVNGKDETSKEATKTDMREIREMALIMSKAIDVNELKKNFDYREEGTEEIAGVTGKKYSVALNQNKPDARVYGVMYKNIVLKSEMGGISMRASKIEENAAVPASTFEVPAGYTIKELHLAEEMNNAGRGESEE